MGVAHAPLLSSCGLTLHSVKKEGCINRENGLRAVSMGIDEASPPHAGRLAIENGAACAHTAQPGPALQAAQSVEPLPAVPMAAFDAGKPRKLAAAAMAAVALSSAFAIAASDGDSRPAPVGTVLSFELLTLDTSADEPGAATLPDPSPALTAAAAAACSFFSALLAGLEASTLALVAFCCATVRRLVAVRPKRVWAVLRTRS